MREVSVRELRTVLARLDDVLAGERELVVTRHGRPIARLLPVEGKASMPSHADLRRRVARQDVGSEVLVREDRDER